MKSMTKKEKKEPMFVTFGRIVTRAKLVGDSRMILLVEKLQRDMEIAVINESKDCNCSEVL